MTRTLLFVSLLAAVGCSPEPGANEVTEYTVPAGNVTLYARKVGGVEAGETVIIVNGGPGYNHNYVRGLQGALATADRGIVAYDQRGTGQSTDPANAPNNFQLSLYVGDLESLRIALGAESLHLVAHDFGGVIALSYAATFAFRVSSIALFGSAPPTDSQLDSARLNLANRITALQGTGEIPTPLPIVNGNDCSPPLVASLPAYYSNPSFSAGDLELIECDNTVKENTDGAVSGYDLSADAAVLNESVLVMYGADDPHGVQMGQNMADAMTTVNPTLQIVNGCGHFWQECTDTVADSINAFLP